MQAKDLSPDLILTNGRFYTLDSAGPVAQAVAVKDGRIVAVGGDAAVGDLAGPGTRQLDLNGRAVIRGILPRPSVDDMKDHLRLACSEAHRYGITSVIEPGLYPQEIRAYQSFYDDGQLSVRVNLMSSWHGFHDDETETVLDRDYFAVPDEEIKDIQVEKTMVAGNFVWRREG